MISTTYSEIILFFQEPFAEIEGTECVSTEPVPNTPSFCRYATVLGNCADFRCLRDRLLSYPVGFIPAMVKSLATVYPSTFGIWLLLHEPEQRQCFAFQSAGFFGRLLYTPSKKGAFPDALLAFLPDLDAIGAFARHVGWPSGEQGWITIGVRERDTGLNISLLQACQQQDYPRVLEVFGVGHAFSFEYYVQKTGRLLAQDAYFIAYMDNSRTFGPFFLTCTPIREPLRKAVQEYYRHPLNRMELSGSGNTEIVIQEKYLDSYEYWRQLT
jgi:hypothetical protein